MKRFIESWRRTAFNKTLENDKQFGLVMCCVETLVKDILEGRIKGKK